MLKKKYMATKESREAVRDLPGNVCDRKIAESLERLPVEQERDKFREKINAIVSESGLSPYVLSIPGVGPALSAAFPAYAGDGSRFGKAGEAANYAGLA